VVAGLGMNTGRGQTLGKEYFKLDNKEYQVLF